MAERCIECKTPIEADILPETFGTRKDELAPGVAYAKCPKCGLVQACFTNGELNRRSA